MLDDIPFLKQEWAVAPYRHEMCRWILSEVKRPFKIKNEKMVMLRSFVCEKLGGLVLEGCAGSVEVERWREIGTWVKKNEEALSELMARIDGIFDD